MNNIRQDSIQWINQQENWKQLVDMYGHMLQGRSLKKRTAPDTVAMRRQLPLSIFENARCALAILDQQLDYLFMNQLYMQRFHIEGYASQQQDKNKIPVLSSQWLHACRQALNGEIHTLTEPPYGSANDCEDLINWKCHPWYEPSGQIGGVIISAERNVMLSRNEQTDDRQIDFFSTALDQVPTGLAMIDRSSGEIYWENQAFKKLLAGSHTSEWADLLPPVRSDVKRKGLYNTASSPLIECTRQYTAAAGQPGWLKIKISPCKKDFAPDTCCWLVVEDITAYKTAEEELAYYKQHDVLTHLYNRSFFDQAKTQLDAPGQLPLSVIICDINGLKEINETKGFVTGDQVLLATARVLQACCRPQDVLARTGGDEFCLILPGTGHTAATALVEQILQSMHTVMKQDELHQGSPIISLGLATKDTVDASFDQVLKLAEDRLFRQKLTVQKSLHHAILASIKATMKEKSFITKEHGERLVNLSLLLGNYLYLSDGQLQELELLANVHDIGKIIISDQIINKPGKLTEEEWQEMKKHPEIGFRIAQASPDISHIADSILYHHEHWDGSGYPRGLKGEQIPILARVLAIVDAYDAMTNDRPYRKAMSHAKAIKEIIQCAGTQFDPSLAEFFIRLMQ